MYAALSTMRPLSPYVSSSTPVRTFSLTATFSARQKPVSKSKAPTGEASSVPSNLSNPDLEKFLAKREAEEGKKVAAPKPQHGKLSSRSIFGDLEDPNTSLPGYRKGMSKEEVEVLKEKEKGRQEKMKEIREHELYALSLDPAPKARMKFEKKMVIKDLTTRGRTTKAIKIARTERESLYRSQDLPTSTKKLTRIMHLIAGKTVEEALIQLRFSKKRVARDVLKGLQIARDEAVAARGMGLGPSAAPLESSKGTVTVPHHKEGAEEPVPASPYMADGSRRRPRGSKGVEVELKDGSKKTVWDPTEMYVDQAWVGKGEQWKTPEFRARGRVNLLTHRTASKSCFYY